ncbi:hypothetical protein BU25DRAFT_414017 [Macroventuria anomochaeta]|uniref:Uncharacterized protein n=1 Tax=Macroventuria anomochaeta TaxID=301207 RepID=A0ACB6RQ00_9PLEO|nr:uncharacterized protein BU25DRAFT_414017 [Macroventuria anomochaeta]KAF2623854.1 hypothetical protein BU25DRAFT_414017 [Macroventuria anomochaeta]
MLVDGPGEHDASSPSGQAVDENGHPHLNASVLGDESTPRSDCSKTAIDCGHDSQHDVTLSVVAFDRPTTNEGISIRGTGMITTHPCSAFDGRGTQSLLQDLQMQEVAANGDGYESHSPACVSQPVTPSHATLTESTPESNPATRLLLPSIMTSLANYPSSRSTCGDRAKRSHDCIEPSEGADEESTTKRQKLGSSIKPEPVEAISADEVMNAESSASDVLEPDATEVLAHRDATKSYDDATTFGAQDEAGIEVKVEAEVDVETDGAVPSTRLNNESVEAESEPCADNIAILNTVMPAKEALHAIVQETAQTFDRRRSEDYQPRLSLQVLPKQFCGPYVQTTDVEMQERITTASLSLTPSSSISPPNLTPEPCVPRLMFEPLKPPTTSHQRARVEAVDFKINEDEMDVSESDEPSDADDDQLSILSQAVKESSDRVNLQAKGAPASGDSMLAIKESTPALEAQAVKATESRPNSCTPCTNRSQTRLFSYLLSDEFEATLPLLPKPIASSTNRLLCNAPLAITDSTAKSTESPISPRPASTETLSSLRHRLELPYGKRNTRSETRTSERAAVSSMFREDELDSVPAPVVKEETPTAAPGKDVTPSAPSKKRKNVPADKLKGRQTRGATTKRDATPKPKTPATRPKLTPKPRVGPEDSPNSASKTITKTTKRIAPKTKTPTRPQVSPITPKVPEKRKTRRSSALEEEIRKASEKEENIAKRTRSKDGE